MESRGWRERKEGRVGQGTVENGMEGGLHRFRCWA